MAGKGGNDAERPNAGGGLPLCRSMDGLSLGGVAAVAPQAQLQKKYRSARPGEVSTFRGAGVVPVCRMANGEVRALLWQPQKGRKKGVRWFDFGGKKLSKSEYTSYCACRKFAKQTYGIFGTNISISGVPPEKISDHLSELYQGLCNLPLMLKSSQEWAQMQLLDDTARIFYNDIHEYHVYLINAPYVPEEILGQVSQLVDGGKRVFKWLSREDLVAEGEHVLAPRLHTENFASWTASLSEDTWVRHGQSYGDGEISSATGSFSTVVGPSRAKAA